VHKYRVDQVLDLLPHRGSSSRLAGECTILSLLPLEGQVAQYRVQSTSEKHQRIVGETDLRMR
jgi:hypothetical protein